MEPKHPPVTRYTLIAFSLSNLCFIPAWRVLFPVSAEVYFHAHPATWNEIAAIFLDVLLLSLLFVGGAVWAGRAGSTNRARVAKVGFLIVSVLGLTNLRPDVAPLYINAVTWIVASLGLTEASNLVSVLVLLAVLGVLSIVLVRFRKTVSRSVRRFVTLNNLVSVASILLLILSPMGLLLLVNAAWTRVQNPNHANFSPIEMPRPAPPIVNHPPARILWIIFDEWDFQLSFDARPSGIDLPEVNRFRQQALSATNVAQAADTTLTAIPALLVGRPVFEAYAVSPNRLMLFHRGQTEHVDWQSQSHAFTQFADLGFRTAAVGWHHPYPRVFGNTVTRSYWQPTYIFSEYHPERPSIVDRMYFYSIVAVQSVPYTSTWFCNDQHQRYLRREHLQAYSNLRQAALQVASDPNLNFVFLHLPIPHTPGIYNARTGTLGVDLENSYLDNLVLLDRTLSDIRLELERTGLWDQTTILLSADHGARLKGWNLHPNWLSERDRQLAEQSHDHEEKVPFLLKLAGQKTALEYRRPINALVSKDLLLAVGRGEITKPDQVIAWLDARDANQDPSAETSPRPDSGEPPSSRDN